MKKWMRYTLLLVAVPLCVFVGFTLFRNRNYTVISILMASLACIPFYFSFEKKSGSARRIVLVAVMTALCVAGRLVFAAIPGFKPVTAIVVITALYFGAEAGFLAGSMTALISNIFYGQGPWTPFQMLVWGLLGFGAGLLARWLKGGMPWLLVYGAFSGAAFSLMMDVWTVLALDGTFNWARYGVAVTAAAPFMAMYALSNVVFLLALEWPIGSRLERIKTKYGL
ncbi:MAG: ECF transporter S component [Christensenellales bacterium]|jgi:energy-coupling factor transport system substrate-specific component